MRNLVNAPLFKTIPIIPPPKTHIYTLMKYHPVSRHKNTGFTLVELLVVITIIAALAALSFSVATKMKKKAEGAKAVQNMRQIGALVGTFAADNSLSLPAAELQVPDGKGGTTQGIMWHQAIILDLYPDVDLAKIRWDHEWWKSNKPVVVNPLMPKEKLRAWFPGFAMNMQIPISLYGWGSDWNSGPKGRNVPLNAVSEPSRTPLVAPDNNWFFYKGKLTEASMKPFTTEGKVPILFVDGHVESMTPREYFNRKLDEMPKAP
jgi:prepilin-type N-terminal cleavage/methylation domain-containing protein/prepilin-type processing-associated H-X9-DG protein